MTNFNSDDLLKAAKTPKDKKKTYSIYVGESTMEDFKALCGDVPFSAVLDELMQFFIQSRKDITK